MLKQNNISLSKISPVSVIQVFCKFFGVLVKIKSIVDVWSLVKNVSFLIKFVKLNRSQNSLGLSSPLPATFMFILKSPMIKFSLMIKFASFT